MGGNRTPTGGSVPTLDKSAIKDALTEVLGKLPVLKDLLFNKSPAQKSGKGGNDKRIEKDGNKEQEEHACKHYQPNHTVKRVVVVGCK